MGRIIKMRGGKVQYDEMRPKGMADDGRQIEMEGEEVVYREMAGVETIEEQVVEAEVRAAVPEMLATEQAMVYWQRLREAGFVDDNCQLLPTTSRRQACDIVDMFARKVGVEAVKWKLFQDLWGKKNMAQDWSQVQLKKLLNDETWKPPRHDEIEDIFGQPV